MERLPAMIDERSGEGGPLPQLEPPPPNVVLLAWRMLRGRMKSASIAGLFVGIPLAIAAYFLVPVKYTSIGIVRVVPTLPKVMYKSDQNEILPLFDAFVSAQASYLSSRRVIDKAVADADLLKAGWKPGMAGGLEDLAKHLQVSHSSGTELISVSVTSRKPLQAQGAVNAVLNAYEQIQTELGGITLSNREEKLEKLQEEPETQLKLMRSQMADLIASYGTDDLDQLYSAKVSELVKLEGLIAELDRQLAQKSGQVSSTQGPPAPEQQSAESLARGDRLLAHLMDEDVALRMEIQRLGAKVTPDHHQMSLLLKEQESSARAVDARLQELRSDPSVGAQQPSDGPTIAQLQSIRDGYEQLRAASSEDTKKMGQTRAAIATLKEQMAETKARLDEVSRELEQFRVENSNLGAGRVSVVQRGDLPFAPSSDKRIPITILAFLAGSGLGIGLVGLRGFVQGGYRFIDELEDTATPAMLLGTVPQLQVGDEELEAQAQLSIHHLRHMLQAHAGAGERSRAISITSAASGDGKTSIAYALGVSFAANGDRTIIVDADLVGSGLTRRLGLAGAGGLREASRREELNGEVHATGIENLWALPVGADDRLDPAKLSPGMMGPLLDRLRGRFDVVIIDTGPILGSLEANLLGRLSDGVVVVVSRGQSAKLVRAALQQIHRLGASCFGLVFNRALPTDFERSTSAGSIRSRVSRVDPARPTLLRPSGARMFTPQAVLAEPHAEVKTPAARAESEHSS
jgi:Mrp family chromosome partitioning ATPase/uncharacterized protein involved in exopolysaccharide biosynthesis